jgi:hypothetical protein
MIKNIRRFALPCLALLLIAGLIAPVVKGQPASFSLLSPSDGENVGTSTPTFEWEVSTGAEWYALQIDNDSDFSSPVYDNDNIGNTTTFTLPPENSLSDGVYYWRVRAENGSGSTWCEQPYSFRVDTVEPAPPLLVRPIDGDNLNDNTPNLEWDPPPENSYPLVFHIQVVRENVYDWENRGGFLVENVLIVGSENYETRALTDNIYYWQVRAIDNAGNVGTFAKYRSFRIDTVPPQNVSLASPSDNALLGTLDVRLEWDPASDQGSGVGNYWVQVDNEAGFSAPFVENTLVSDTFLLISLPKSGRYYWRVRAVDRAGNMSENWSPTFGFTVFIWKPIEQWSGTLACVSEWNTADVWLSSARSAPAWVPEDAWLAGSAPTTLWRESETWIFGVSAPEGAWRVSNVWTFASFSPVLPPRLLSPANGENLSDNTPVLCWENWSPADNFEIQLDSESSFASPRTLVSHDNSIEVVPPLSDGVWYWRVRTFRENIVSSWSESKSFRVDTIAPDAPSLTQPENGESINDSTPLLTWNPPLENSYPLVFQVEVYDESFSSLIASSGWISSENWEVTATLSDGTTYWWRVRARDNAGNIGQFSPARWFVIDLSAPDTPVPASPIDNQLLADSTPKLEWTHVSDPSGITYEVKIDGVLVATGLSDNFFIPASSLSDGQHSWRVRAVDGAGNTSYWSAKELFTIDTTPPPAPNPKAPANGATVFTSRPTFEWSAVTDPHGIRAYELEIVGRYHITGITATTYQLENTLSDGSYSWRVRAIDNVGNVGPWSAEWNFAVWIPKQTSLQLEIENATDNFEMFTQSSVLITAVLKDQNGKAVPDKRIYWSVSGGGFLSTTRTVTSQYGRSYVTYTAPKVEKTTFVVVEARFQGDERYLESRGLIGIRVYPAPLPSAFTFEPKGFVLGPGENLVIRAIFEDNAGNRIPNRSIEWDVLYGSLIADGKVDEQGVATARYFAPSNVRQILDENISVSFAGDWWYAPASAVLAGKIVPASVADFLTELIENIENSSSRFGLTADDEWGLTVKKAYTERLLGACFEITGGEEKWHVTGWFRDRKIENFAVNIRNGAVVVWAGAENVGGRAIFFNVVNKVFGDAGPENLGVYLNGRKIKRVPSLTEAFRPTAEPKYYVGLGDYGYQFVVWIPKFSVQVVLVRVETPPPDVHSSITMWLFIIVTSSIIFQRHVRPRIEILADRVISEKRSETEEAPYEI